jgi:RNA polymerase subunit RPABC4/transcription elongation factor Spt4
MAEEDEEGPELCPHCGSVVLSEFEYCPACGRRPRVMKIPASSFRPTTEMHCPRCDRAIESSHSYCPYCGHRQGAPVEQKKELDRSYFLSMYLLSVLIPIVGLVLWRSWSKNSEGEWRTRGTACLASACVGLVMYILVIGLLT